MTSDEQLEALEQKLTELAAEVERLRERLASIIPSRHYKGQGK
jgi:hypothetical protein